MNYKPAYVPTKEDIAKACERIRAGWTERQRRDRQAVGRVAAVGFIRAKVIKSSNIGDE